MFAELCGGVHVLCLNGLVDKDLEGGKVMKVKLTAEPCVESSAEPFLLLGVGGAFFSSIRGQPVELTAVLVNSPSTLREVAEFLTFAVHQTLGNVVLTERSAELVPCGGWTFGTHVEVILPPRACCSLKVVGGIGHLVIICNTSCLQFPLDTAEPIIGFKGLSRITEDRRMKMNEVIQSHHLIPLLSGVACYDFQQRVRVSAILLDLHQNLCHSRRRWKTTSFGIIMTLVPAKLSTGSVRHPEDKINVKQS